jgi:glycosyltransferase involved in cell wall biosynthesis
MSPPRVSILLPTFDRPALLRQTLESVFAQSFRDWELVIADDGSGEETRTLLRALAARPQVQLIELPHSGRPVAVRNAALRAARGEYVAFLDSDDLWTRDKLARQLAQLESGIAGQWSYTNFICIDEHGRRLPEDALRRWHPHTGDVLRQAITGELSIRMPTVMARRELIERAGGFDEAAPTEIDLWIRLAALSPIQVVDAPLAAIREHTQNYSANWAYAYERRELALRKLEPRFHGSIRRLVRSERVRNCVRLSEEHARRGTAAGMLTAWLSGAPYGWRKAGWWWNGARVIARLPRLPARAAANR